MDTVPQNTTQSQPTNGQSATDSPDVASEKLYVTKWTKKIHEAKKHHEQAFKRMRDDMNFCRGLQWNGQKTVAYDKYIANLTLHLVNEKVASLYSQNPKVEAVRRQRMDYAIWDGKVETLMSAMQSTMQSSAAGQPDDPQAAAIMMDFKQGKDLQEMVDKIGKTLEIVYTYQMDCQTPEYKSSLKQLVRRVCTTGVGYVKTSYAADQEPLLVTSELQSTVIERANRIRVILNKMDSGELEKDGAEVENIKMLASSIMASEASGISEDVKERLVFDFPPSTSIIIDPVCRNVKGFVGAKWIAQEFIMGIDAINAFFGSEITATGDVVKYTTAGTEYAHQTVNEPKDGPQPVLACLWCIYDLDNKSCMYIVDGWKTFVEEPKPVQPVLRNFWPIRAITFNDIESEPGCEAELGIFPPSDVQLVWHAQKEWNRSREALRRQRTANAPKYMATKGVLTDDDKEVLKSAEDNEVVELQGVPQGTDPNTVIRKFDMITIDPRMYDTNPLKEDIQGAVGVQGANLGIQGASPETATGETIAEQSRATGTTSNIDDLDDLLSGMAEDGGEIILRMFSPETVQRIVGSGAVFPVQNKEDFINQLYLTIVASSSGRPNKALEIANFKQLAELLMQAGANPQAIIREAIKRLDDNLNPEDFFPVGQTQPMPAQSAGSSSQQGAAQQRLAQPAVFQQNGVPNTQAAVAGQAAA